MHRFAMVVIALLLAAGCQRKTEVSVQESSQTVSAPMDTSKDIDSTGPQPVFPKPAEVRTSPTKADQQNVTVDLPHPGDRIHGSSITIRGTARTFENSIAYKILDPEGRVLASGHGMTHGSMGHFGPYDFSADVGKYQGPATVEVFRSFPQGWLRDR